MSMAIKVAKGQFQGDPGLFGFLGKAARTIGGAAFGLAAQVGLPGARFGQALVQRIPGGRTRRGAVQVQRQVVRPGVGAGLDFRVPSRPPPPRSLAPRSSVAELAEREGTQLACTSGFHPNKADYFLKDGTFIEEGTRCVRNRRRNPFNPRATDRAIGRIEGAKRAASRLGRITIRAKC